MSPLYIIVGLVALQRLSELPIAARNERLLRARGAYEVGGRHYPLMILLHASWLIAILTTTSSHAPIHFVVLFLFVLLQFARAWVITTLGRFWTTRVIVVPDAPLIKTGPYRFVKHPNYLIVIAEIALLPLVFGNWPVALVWSALNLALIRHRIRIEDSANAKKA